MINTNRSSQNNQHTSTDIPTLVSGPQAASYAGEMVGGYRAHNRALQDAFWPNEQEGGFPTSLRSFDLLSSGRLYLLADGQTACAAGQAASRRAVQAVGMAYYAHSPGLQESADQRKQRLTEAVWQAQQKMVQSDESFFCRQEECHSSPHLSKKNVTWRGKQAYCGTCGHAVVALQSTLIAALLHGRHLILLMVGDSVALRVPASRREPLEVLADSKDNSALLGMPNLSDKHLKSHQTMLEPGDCLVLCSSGFMKTLKAWQKATGNNWLLALRQRLIGANLPQATQELIEELHTFRQATQLNDDLTLLAIAIPEQATLTTLRDEMLQASQKLNHSPNTQKPPPHLYHHFIKSAEAFWLHEAKPDAKIWQQYGVALREKALFQIRTTGALNDTKALALMKDAAQVGDSEAARWLTVMDYAQQIVTWRQNKQQLLTQPRQWHEEAANTLMAIKLADRLPGNIIVTLRNALKRLIKFLKEAKKAEVATVYVPLFRSLDVNFQPAANANDSTDVPTDKISNDPDKSGHAETQTPPTYYYYLLHKKLATVKKEWLVLVALLVVLSLLGMGSFTFFFSPSSHTATPSTPLVTAVENENESKATKDALNDTTPTVSSTITTPIPWVPQTTFPLSAKPILIEMTLNDLVGVNTLEDLVKYFDPSHNDIGTVRELTPNYPTDGPLRPDAPIRGLIPTDPLFLFVGQIAKKLSYSDKGYRFPLHLAVNQARTVMVRMPVVANEMAEQQQLLENWQVEHGGWVWVLASSPPLAQALRACRNSLLFANQQLCMAQEKFIKAEKKIEVESVLLMGIENGRPPEFLIGQESFENRWVYADLGPDGLPLLIQPDLAEAIQERGKVGLVNITWSSSASDTIIATYILQREEDRIYRPKLPKN